MKSISMDEVQKKLSQRYEARPRKVRFKISSGYSGRVLKKVYEDGQELEPPEEESPHRFLHHSFESGDHFNRVGEAPESRFYSSAKLTAQRISVFKEGSKYNLASNPPLFSDYQASDSHHRPSPILDFGKIVIYTSNLKIIRTPMDKKELMRKIIQNEGTDDWSFMYRDGKEGDGHQINGCVKDAENQLADNQYVQEGDTEHNCSQCKGSGSAPCSLCHGSKFSMLANRFKESYRALRCPACNENGLQPCQVCVR
ncbi:glutaredoxin and cysteine rich domain containing 2 [Chelydra serpentina]|uniref:Glutaredoxin and cysteine rich domain containing 2 n=2 Tax=Chelydra serpentina TaxID=8475 RepID=A0A8T1TJJ0_CHESE|nr:glutaredoxin and cysteine rich domain containing 2 [Chelydra serpentina]